MDRHLADPTDLRWAGPTDHRLAGPRECCRADPSDRCLADLIGRRRADPAGCHPEGSTPGRPDLAHRSGPDCQPGWGSGPATGRRAGSRSVPARRLGRYPSQFWPGPADRRRRAAAGQAALRHLRCCQAPCSPAPCYPAPCYPAPCYPAPCYPAPCYLGRSSLTPWYLTLRRRPVQDHRDRHRAAGLGSPSGATG
jgi:hypothetical protein